MGVVVLGAGHYLPGKAVSSVELLEQYGYVKDSGKVLTEADLTKAHDIQCRYIAGETTTLADIATEAASRAITSAGIADPREANIDQVLLCTSTPDETFPNTASVVVGRLGIEGTVSSQDSNAACAGFAKILGTGGKNTDNQPYRNTLLIGADILSRVTDYSDYKTGTLFGDGAGAMLLGFTEEERGVISVASDTLPNRGILYCPLPGGGINQEQAFIQMSGGEVYVMVLEELPKNIERALNAVNLEMKDVDRYIFHQANARMLIKFAKQNGIDLDKVPVVGAQQTGNTSAGTIAIAQSLEMQSRPPKRGEIYVYSGFGAGMVIETVVMVM